MTTILGSWGAVKKVARQRTGSTSDDAAAAFRGGENGAAWFTADLQEAGRGRRGKVWAHRPGNFAGTLLLPVSPALLSPPSGLAFASALSVAGAAEQMGVDRAALTLKWPNDVLLSGRKLGGILIELLTDGARQSAAIGIGVNLRVVPEDQEAAALGEVIDGAVPSPAQFLEALHAACGHWVERLGREGFGPIRQAWLDRAAGLGGPLVARLAREEISGTFAGIDAVDGALLLRRDGTVHKVSAADIFLGQASD